jgi:hypothetical protein
VERYAAPDAAAVASSTTGRAPVGAEPLVLDRAAYLELFRNVRDEIAIGEASVSYFALPRAAAAIREAVPDARLLFVLRDPADRMFSRYTATLEAGAAVSFREWARASMHTEDEWGPERGVGRYAAHLQRFFDTFPRDRIRVYLYEEYRAAPRTVLRDIFAFLGVDPAYAVDVSRRHNETMAPRFPWLHRLRRRVVGGRSLTSWLPSAARRTVGRLYRRRRAGASVDPADRRLLVDYFRDDILRTAALLDRDLSAWLR